MLKYLDDNLFLFVALTAILLLVLYLVRLNQLLLGTPDEIKKIASERWTKDVILDTYRRLEDKPITTTSYSQQIPPKLERRYIVTGGSGEFHTHTKCSKMLTGHGRFGGRIHRSPAP